MEYFKNAELREAYGSTEAGLVTLLRPGEQFKKLGAIGREIFGIDRIKVLDENGEQVPRGQVRELYSRTSHVFNEYWKDPEKTKSAFKGEWFSAGEMAYQDEDGYYVLVDRRANMIITGGENEEHPFQVEKYSRHAKHQGKDDKGNHHSDQHVDDLLEEFHGRRIRDELYINMKAVLNF